jgi:heterodisulfide reductase subunit B
MNTFLYYPGCSMEGSARAYQASLDVVCDVLGVRLRELDDWNCCGATEYAGISLLRSHALIGRNLALAEAARGASDSSVETVVAPCSACYLNLAKTDAYLRQSPALARRVNEALGAAGLHYTPGAVRVRHLLDILIDDVGLDAIAGRVTRPLSGLRVAPYLGCMLPRPDLDGRWPVREHPLSFDQLLAALGAEVVDFPLKTDCCGGHMTQISPATGFELIRRLVHEATARHADIMATVCPMCQMNVDAYQGEMNRYFRTHYTMPILFFTQLMGLAFGATASALAIGSELVASGPALARIGIEIPPAEAEANAAEAAELARRARSRRSKALPMPRMPGKGNRR